MFRGIFEDTNFCCYKISDCSNFLEKWCSPILKSFYSNSLKLFTKPFVKITFAGTGSSVVNLSLFLPRCFDKLWEHSIFYKTLLLPIWHIHFSVNKNNCFTPFLTNVPLLYPLKTSENLRYVFMGYRSGTLVDNSLILSICSKLTIVSYNPLLRNVVKWSDTLNILQHLLQDF